MAMKYWKKAIPNIITSIRIIGALVLIFLESLSLPFFIVYAVCGASDALDGFAARKLNAQSKVGSILDSVSDLIFYFVMAVKIFPTMQRLLSIGNWIVILVPIALQLVAYIICLIRFRCFSSLHTYANKMTSFAVFFFPFTFIGEIFLLYNLYIYIFGAVAIYASIEMCLIHIVSKKYDTRNGTIFFVKRNEQEEQKVIQ